MMTLFTSAKEAEAAITSHKNLDKAFQLMQKEKEFMNSKSIYKEYLCDITHQKKKTAPTKYIIKSRIVIPLMVANERVVELFAKEEQSMVEVSTPEKLLEPLPVAEKFEHMSISDQREGARQSKSLKVKRSYMEMQKVDAANFDLFSVGVLNAIFAYIDFNSLKMPEKDQYTTIGHFAALIYEVSVNIHKQYR